MKNFYLVIIALLVGVIFLQRACTPSPSGGGTTVDVDTVWLTKDTTIYKIVTHVRRDTIRRPGDSVFIADTNYHALKLQFETLAKNYSARNIYKDTFKLDTFGLIVLNDTIQYNQLGKRSYNLSYKVPSITRTVHAEPVRQLYLGGGISTTTQLDEAALQLGLLYKNKKDQLFSVYTLLDGTSAPQVGVSSYWKLSLKK